jgi:hypothetical protein
MDDAKSKFRGELKDELYLFSVASLARSQQATSAVSSGCVRAGH